MSLDAASSLVRSCALLLLGVAALVFALRGATPAFAQTPPPGAVCIPATEAAGAALLSAKAAEGYGAWMNARIAEGRRSFVVLPTAFVCAW